jgi:hypothetical protein
MLTVLLLLSKFWLHSILVVNDHDADVENVISTQSAVVQGLPDTVVVTGLTT